MTEEISVIAQRKALYAEIKTLDLTKYCPEAMTSCFFDLATTCAVQIGMPKESFLTNLGNAFDLYQKAKDVKP